MIITSAIASAVTWVVANPMYVILASGAIITQATDTTVAGVPLVGLTAPTLLGIFFIMFMRGDIVSGKVHRERVSDYKDEALSWREAHSVSEEARKVITRQNDELIEVGRTVRAIAVSIRAQVDLPEEPDK
jgi:hypothetical protein